MAVSAGSFELPAWLNQSNTDDLLPRAAVQGAEAGQAIAQGIRAKQELEQRLDQQKQIETQKAKIFATQQSALADYKQAIKDGMKQSDALAKYGPGLFAGNPAALATSLDRERANEIRATYEDKIAGIRDASQKEGVLKDALAHADKSDALKMQETKYQEEIKAKDRVNAATLAQKNKALADTLKANKEIQSGHDATKLDAETLRLQNKLLQNKSRIDDVTFSSFNKQAAAISNDKELTTPAKMRKIQELQVGVEKVLADRRDAAAKSGTPVQPAKPGAANIPELKIPIGQLPDEVPIIYPDGRHATVPKANLRKAMQTFKVDVDYGLIPGQPSHPATPPDEP